MSEQLETKDAEIFKALNAVNKAISAIAKQNNGQFKAQRIDDILNQIHPLFSENNIIVQSKIISREARTEEIEKTSKDGKYIQRLHWVVSTFQFFFLSCIDGTFVDVIEDGEGNDFSDKAGNKAKSYALKYALIRLFTIPVDDKSIEDGDRQQTKPTNKPKPKAVLMTDSQRKMIHAICGEMKWDYKSCLGSYLGIDDTNKVPSTNNMTKTTATKFIEFLKNSQTVAKDGTTENN